MYQSVFKNDAEALKQNYGDGSYEKCSLENSLKKKS